VQQLALKTSTALSGKIKDNLIAKLSSNIEFQDEVADVGVFPFLLKFTSDFNDILETDQVGSA
jgi:hypothetical protein